MQLSPSQDHSHTNAIHQSETPLDLSTMKGRPVKMERVGDRASLEGIILVLEVGARMVILNQKLLKNLQTSVVMKVVRNRDGYIYIYTENSVYKVLELGKNVLPTMRKRAPSQPELVQKQTQERFKQMEVGRMTQKYLQDGYLDFTDQIPDGFLDGGRGAQMSFDHAGKCTVRSTREVMEFNSVVDSKLHSILQKLEKDMPRINDLRMKINYLAILVSNLMGGIQQNKLNAGDRLDAHNDREIAKLRAQNPDRPVLIGELNYGVCRHRALLFKYLADRLGIESRVVRGRMFNGNHAWNVVKIDGEYFVVDVMQSPGELLESNSFKARFYTREDQRGPQGGFGGESIHK